MSQIPFHRLFQLHRPELQSYLARLVRCRETAADLLQDTFLRFLEHAPKVEIGNSRAYLYRTAHNLAVDHLRKEDRRCTDATAPEQLWDVPDQQPAPDHRLHAQQELQSLYTTLEELPPLTRRIFELNRMHGLSYQEVADALNISNSSVQKHLARALLHTMQWRKLIP